MALPEKLEYIRRNYPEVYGAIEADVPHIIKHPESPTAEDVDHYNFWVGAILDDEIADNLFCSFIPE